MQPQLALVFTILFISIAFIIDKKRSEASFALLVPLIWVMYCGSRPIGDWFNPYSLSTAEINYTAGSPIDRLFLSILISMGVVILLRRKVGFTEIIKSNRWIFGLFIYMGISIFWSDYMEVSLKRWVRATGDLVMILIILTETDSVQAITSLFRRCAYVLIPLSALFIKYFRHIGVGYDHQGRESWLGVATGKNSLGQLCFVMALFFLWIVLKKYMNKQLLKDKFQLSVDLLLLIVTLWILNGTVDMVSVTALTVFVMGAFCLITLMKLKLDPKRIWLFFVIPLYLFFFIELLVNAIHAKGLVELFVGFLGRDMTLRGRTDIWKNIMAIAVKRPWVGTGYGGFWIGNLTHDLWDMYPFEIKSAHNGYLDVFLELGVVGLFLLMAVIFVAYRNIRETLSAKSELGVFELGVFKLALLTTICVYNISESEFLKPTTLLSFSFLLIAVNIPKRKNSLRELSHMPKSFATQ